IQDTRTVLGQTTTGHAKCRADITFPCTNTIVSIQRGQSATAADLSFTTNASEIAPATGTRVSSTRWKTRLAKTATPADIWSSRWTSKAGNGNPFSQRQTNC